MMGGLGQGRAGWANNAHVWCCVIRSSFALAPSLDATISNLLWRLHRCFMLHYKILSCTCTYRTWKKNDEKKQLWQVGLSKLMNQPRNSYGPNPWNGSPYGISWWQKSGHAKKRSLPATSNDFWTVKLGSRENKIDPMELRVSGLMNTRIIFPNLPWW